MTDWLGMIPPPRSPRPELKAPVLTRAVTKRRSSRWVTVLAAAAAVAAVAGAVWWARTTILDLQAQRAQLAAELQAKADTLSLIRSRATRVLQIPVSTNGQVGAITIFADTASHRWLVTCHHLAPNQPGESYELWFITDRGLKRAAQMAMARPDPMMIALEMPKDGARVTGAAMSIEPDSSATGDPRGPIVFHLML